MYPAHIEIADVKEDQDVFEELFRNYGPTKILNAMIASCDEWATWERHPQYLAFAKKLSHTLRNTVKEIDRLNRESDRRTAAGGRKRATKRKAA